jgi:L-ascorbate metabolism protein UlaG (beta-lactamase superfamily)
MNASVSAALFSDERLEFTHYGAAGWKITDGRSTVLLDPYFTRLRYAGKRFGLLPAPSAPGDKRPAYSFDEIVPSDVDTIDQHITQADYILVSHAHFNHCMDVPHIAKRTGGLVLGNRSVTNIAKAYGVDGDQLLSLRGGEDYDFEHVSIRAIPSLHSALSDKRYFDAGIVPEDLQGPLPLKAFSEGGTLAYLVRFKHHEVLLFGSMNYIEREVQGLAPSIILVPAARPRLQIRDYTQRLLQATQLPKTVIATHWDIQTYPYGANQSLALEQAETFIAEVKASDPEAKVVLPLHFDTFSVLPDGSVKASPERR